MSDYVRVDDWGTKMSQETNFVARSGYVKPGPVTALLTRFGYLTYEQVCTLADENAYYRRIDNARRASEGRALIGT